VNVRVHADAVGVLAVCLSLLNRQFYVEAMLFPNLSVQLCQHFLAHLVGTKGHSKVIICSHQHLKQLFFNVVVDVVHAKVKVFELRIFDCYPFLHCLSLFILFCYLLNVVQNWNGLFRLLGCFLLLVLFNYCISVL